MLQAEFQIAKFERMIGEQRLGIKEASLKKLLTRPTTVSTKATASDFSSWVYRADHPSSFQGDRRPSLLQIARKKISDVLDRLADGASGDWQLLSCDSGLKSDTIYTSPVLYLANEPLRLLPDVVYRHTSTGVIVVFEYKIPNSDVVIPNEGWPNLAVQLWTYGWAAPWADNPHVLLVGVAFDYVLGDYVIRSPVPRTLKTDARLNSACAELFKAWGGRIDTRCLQDRALRKLLSP